MHKPDDLFKYTKEYFVRYAEIPQVSNLIVIVGPTGVGKGSLITKILEEFKDKIVIPKQVTNKDIKDDSSFNKISTDVFLSMKNDNKFVKITTDEDEFFYATSIEEINSLNEKNKLAIIELNINDAKKLYLSGLIDAYYVSIYASNLEVIRERLRLKGGKTLEEISNMLIKAKEEISLMDNSNIFDYKILNDDFTIAYQDFVDIIYSIKPELNQELVRGVENINLLVNDYTKESKEVNKPLKTEL